MNIDYKKLGYRWRGYYSDSVVYDNKDVVYKEGAAFYYDSLTATFKIFAKGQEEAISKGEIVGEQTGVKGFPGEILFVQNGTVKFQHPIDRNGTRVVSLATNALKGNVMYPSDEFMTFVMADGSVRGIGRTYEGYIGASNDKDEAHGAMVPTRVNFPLGTPPIVKAFKSVGASYFVDADGTLWCTGDGLYAGCNGLGPGNEFSGNEGFSEKGPVNMSANTDIGDDPIDKVFSFYCYNSGYYCMYALSTTGKVYSWGHDPNKILGNRRSLEGGSTYNAMLIEFTKDTPIVDIGSDAHTVTGMIDVDGNLWTIGSGGYNWHGNSTNGVFRKVQLQSKCVQFQGDSGEGHWNHGHYLGSALLLDDGRLYQRGNNFDQVGWGTPGSSTSNAFRDDRHLLGKDISFFAWKHGGYAIMVAQRFDGSWMYRGDNRWSMSPSKSPIHPTSADDWADNYPRMAPTYYNSNIVKYKFHGGNISEGAIGLLSDGRAFVDGINRVGQNGLGLGDSHRYLHDPTGSNTFYETLPDFFVPINEKIIDIDMAGYHYHWYNSSYHDHSTYYFLTENGNVYATGSNNYYKNGKYPQAHSYSPSRIIF